MAGRPGSDGREHGPQEAQEAQGQACRTASPTRPDVALRGDAVKRPEPRGWQHMHINKNHHGEYSTLRPACWAPVGSPFPGLCGFPIALAACSGGTSAGRPSRGQRVGPPRDTCMEGAPWAVPRRRTGSQELRATPRFSFPCIRDENHTHSGPGPLLPNNEVRSQG